MHSSVERPYPVDYDHPNGEQAKIHFIWGDPKSMAPIGISIWINAGRDRIQLGEEMGDWHTFGDARLHGIALAAQWLNRLY